MNGVRKRAQAAALALLVLVAGAAAVQAEAQDNETAGHQKPHGLVVESTSGGRVTVPGEGYFDYRHASVIDLIAEAEEGYEFDGWLGDTGEVGDTTSPRTTLTMLGDYAIEAVFARRHYKVTAASTKGGTIKPAGKMKVPHGEDKLFTITPDAGHRIDDVRLTENDDERSVYDDLKFENRKATFVLEDVRTCYVLFAVFKPQTHSLTIDSTEGGEVTKPGESTFTYEYGKQVQLVASPERYYQFERWTGDTYAIKDPKAGTTTIAIHGDYEITARFEPFVAELSVSSTDGGTVEKPGEGRFVYEKDERVTLKASADEGYEFVRWRGDIEAVENPKDYATTIVMHEDYKIEADFRPARHELDIESTDGGTVTVPGEGVHKYEHATRVALRVSADEGYVFAGWRGDIGTIDDPLATRTAIDIRGDYSITAAFVPEQYVLAIESTEGGSVTCPGEGEFEVYHGEVVPLSAEAEDCHRFLRWTGDIETIADPYSEDTQIEMMEPYSIKAEFEPREYALTIDSMEGGSVTAPGKGSFMFEHGTVVDLVAEAEDCHRFVRWTGDIETIADPYSPDTEVELLANYTITAVFEPRVYKLTIDSMEGGSVTAPGKGSFMFEHGTVVDLVAKAEDCHRFVRWGGDNETIDDPYSEDTQIEMLADHVVKAEFKEVPRITPDESIQDAIDRAEAGEVICLAAGEWRENLYITKDITLKGQGAGHTVIRSAVDDRPVIEIAQDEHGESPKVDLQGLTVTGGRNIEGYGLLIKDSSQVTITESYITDNTHGIMLWLRRPTLTIRDSKVARNRRDGIVLSYYSTANLEGNVIQANGRFGVSLYARPCFDVGLYFLGTVKGAGNTIPGPREPDGNEHSAVCPGHLEFLRTEEGGEWRAPR